MKGKKTSGVSSGNRKEVLVDAKNCLKLCYLLSVFVIKFVYIFNKQNPYF